MDKFAPLEPIRLHATAATAKSLLGRSSSTNKRRSTLVAHHLNKRVHLIGRLPIEVHVAILTYLPTPDVPAYARVSRALANLAREERLWERRWRRLGLSEPVASGKRKVSLEGVLDRLEEQEREEEGRRRASMVPTIAVGSLDGTGSRPKGGGGPSGTDTGAFTIIGDEDEDEFGDFATAGMSAGLSGLESGFGLTKAGGTAATPTSAPGMGNGDLLGGEDEDEMGDFVGGGGGSFSPSPFSAVASSFAQSQSQSHPQPQGTGPAQGHRQSLSTFTQLSQMGQQPRPPPLPSLSSTPTFERPLQPQPFSPRSPFSAAPHSHPPSPLQPPQKVQPQAPTYRMRYLRAHLLLCALLPHLSSPPHLVLSTLFPSSPSMAAWSISEQARTLHALLLFLSPAVQPTRKWEVQRAALRSAVDRFDALLLGAFDSADSSGASDDDGELGVTGEIPPNGLHNASEKKKSAERAMREAAYASWEVFYGADLYGMGGGGSESGSGIGEWEMGKVWAEKREIFYEDGRWDWAGNFTKDNPPRLDFTPFDAFMAHVLATLRTHGARAVRVFPPQSRVLDAFAERVAVEVVGEYIAPLLTHARSLSNAAFLQASAAAFGEAWRMVDVLVDVAKQNAGEALSEDDALPIPKLGKLDKADNQPEEASRWEEVITQTQAEDVVYRMFEPNMDEYLDEEVESVKQAFEVVCRGWERETTSARRPGSVRSGDAVLSATTPTSTTGTQPRFVGAQNAAQMKRNVLASFTNVLLLPVTLVPRTVGVVGGAVGTAAVQGIAMLNPSRWVYGAQPAAGVGVAGQGAGVGGSGEKAGYSRELEGEAVVFEGEDDEDVDAEKEREQEEDGQEDEKRQSSIVEASPWAGEVEAEWDSSRDRRSLARSSVSSFSRTTTLDAPPPSSTAPTSLHSRASSRDSTPAPSIRSVSIAHARQGSNSTTTSRHTAPSLKQRSTANSANFAHLQLYLSLDVALELIHADRDALKRVESFAGYPGAYGHRVRETIEEVFVLLLKAVGERHVVPGFQRATEEMRTYQPADHEGATSVAPLVQFFELVHIGDMIQSMVQVYFDKELAPHIDRTDFLNGVVREKKRFENMLDDAVAAGLNAGTDVLMNQVDHIITTLTKPREYYPPEDAPLDLGATQGCTEAIKCLETHCSLLKGSTSREVLEVFYQEVGIRLLAILQKHLKRQIISLSGGFQVIADLNAYYNFVASLKVPAITSEFSHLKMLGHVYVVEDAKDLAQIVRDVTRYGGAYRPEDIYEFIQRRSDWKKIEKIVDKTMYNLSFKEDCVIV